MKAIAALIIVGAFTLVATQALAGDPTPTVANGHVNPQVGQVIGYGVPDGAGGCRVDDLTLSASPAAGEDVALEANIGDDCTITFVAPGGSPQYAPGGQTSRATP